MKIALFGTQYKEESKDSLSFLLEKFKEDVFQQVWIYQEYFDQMKELIPEGDKWKPFSKYDEIRGAEFLMSLGGDGTLLSALNMVRNSGIPVLGLNLGRLGFLATISRSEIDKAINDLIQRKYNIERRTLISIDDPQGAFGEFNYALNEVTVLKNDSSSMITIHAYLGEEYLNTYWADGLIISTPTGSTGYNLSCGGPIIMPGSGVFILTPIAPHNLNVRPLVIPDHRTVRLEVEVREGRFLISLDSRHQSLEAPGKLEVRKHHSKLNLVRLDGYTFTQTLRNKLLWGSDRRN